MEMEKVKDKESISPLVIIFRAMKVLLITQMLLAPLLVYYNRLWTLGFIIVIFGLINFWLLTKLE